MSAGLLGGIAKNVGNAAQRGGGVLSERFEGKSHEWQKKHERAFEMAQNESRQHFHRCPSYNKYVCDSCGNENEGLCTDYAPRQEIYVAKTRADSMKCNIDSAGRTATV